MSILWAVSAGLFAASAAVAASWWWLEVRRPSASGARISRVSVDEGPDASGLRDFVAQATPLAAPVSRRGNPRSRLGYSPPVDPEITADFPSPH